VKEAGKKMSVEVADVVWNLLKQTNFGFLAVFCPNFDKIWTFYEEAGITTSD
jgi:hypothetical protein